MKKLFLLLVFAINVYGQSSDTFADSRDGQTYKWIKIGNQIWMAENLNCKPRTGWAQYGNIYGLMYNWETAKYVAPLGWHLPSDEEWKELETYLGMSRSELDKESYLDRESGRIGLKLKSSSGWQFYMQNGNGTDLVGFTALPGGHRKYYSKRFMYYGSGITFWTSTSYDNKSAYTRELGSHFDGIGRSPYYKVHGCYVRCVKD